MCFFLFFLFVLFRFFFQIFNIDRTPHCFLSILSYRTPAFSFRCTISSAHFQPWRPGIIQWGEGVGGLSGRNIQGKSQCGTVSPRCFCKLSEWKKKFATLIELESPSELSFLQNQLRTFKY